VVELDTHNDNDDDPCDVELVADAAASSNALELPARQRICLKYHQRLLAPKKIPLDDFDQITWDIDEEHARALDQIIDSLTTDINADEIVVEPSPPMHVPAPDLVDTDDDKPDEHDRDTRAATTSQEWLELGIRWTRVAACDQRQCTPALPMCTTQITTPSSRTSFVLRTLSKTTCASRRMLLALSHTS
jgi:hypothetical protein